MVDAQGGAKVAKRRLVVVGNGMAGARTVEEILERGGGDQFDITMFGDEPYGNYDRIALSHVLSGEQDETEIFLNSLAWYEENGITLRAGCAVTRVDRWAKIIYAADGSETPYDILVFATGSRSFIVPLDGVSTPEGGLLPGVVGFRTIDDTREIVSLARQHDRAVVIGGGLLGLEAARGLQSHGVKVELLQAMSHLMNQQLDLEGGQILKRSVEALGINIRVEARSVAVTGEDRVTGVRMADGEVIPCGLVVMAAGIRPNVDVAVTSGFTVERAIVVDDQMTTNDPDVYAVGECAQHRGMVYGLVAPLYEQARVVADQITARDPDSAYHGSRTATKLKVAGVDVSSMGVTAPEHEDDELVVFSEPGRGIYKSAVIRGDRLVGATLVGDVRKSAQLMQAFNSGAPVPEERSSLLFDIGGPAEVGVAEMPDDAQVCNCNGVCKSTLVDTVKCGTKTVAGVMNATRAGKGCGSCKGLVAQIVEWAAGGEMEVDPAESYYVPGIPLSKPDLMTVIREQRLTSVSAVFAALAPEGTHDAKSKMGLTSLLRMMWPDDFVDERDGRFINDRVHANIQRDGTFSVVPQMKGGVTSIEQLRKIADVAEKYDVPMIKLTGGQRIDLLGVPKEDLPKIWADLDMPSGYAYGKSFRTVKTCVGSDFCRFGLGDSTALGIALESRYQGIEGPGKMKLAVSGCPRNCAESLVKDVGVVAVEGGRWEIYVGGAAGAHIRKGDLLVTVDTPEEVITLTGRFLQYYRENANWLERSYAFVPRIGIEKVRAIIVDDSEGIAARLDAAMDEAVAAYRDPWKERAAQAVPGQFRTSLPLLPLPQVPIRDGSTSVSGGLVPAERREARLPEQAGQQ